jgi:pilus assembly protein Flp/PilA
MLKRLRKRSQKGAALLEYSLLIAGIALIGAAAIAIFGHKTTDMMVAVAAVLPGAHTDDNNPIISGKIIETTATGNGVVGTTATAGITLDIDAIVGNTGQARLGTQMGLNSGGGNSLASLVLEPAP